MDSLIWTEVTVMTMLQKISILNKCSSFELYIHRKDTFLTNYIN